MKRILGVAFSLILTVSVLAGCGKKEETRERRQTAQVSTETIESTEAPVETAEQNVAGAYYDEVSFNEDGFLYFIVLRDNGQVLFMIQDITEGTWENDVITLPEWQCSYEFEITDDGIYIPEMEQTFIAAPSDVIPDTVREYIETGSFPYFNDSNYSEEAHFSGIYESGDGIVSITYTDQGYYVTVDIIEIEYFSGMGEIMGNQLYIDFEGYDEPVRAVFYKNGSDYELYFTEMHNTFLEAGTCFSGFKPNEASYDMPGEPVRESVDINPMTKDNFRLENGIMVIYGSGDDSTGYIFDENTIICQDVPCYDDGCDSLTWLDRYLENSIDNDDADTTKKPYAFSGFGMGDVWTIEVQGNHIELVKLIGWWD